jgi:hypothetical protein
MAWRVACVSAERKTTSLITANEVSKGWDAMGIIGERGLFREVLDGAYPIKQQPLIQQHGLQLGARRSCNAI